MVRPLLKSTQVMRTALFIVSCSWLLACSSNDKIDTSTAEGAFELAEKYQKDERFEEAITYYSEVKNKHPYSRFAVLSELAIADIEYQRENYPAAQTAYRLFKELHPTHEKSDYVTFRLGQSIFMQLPSTIDRDLADANSAILYFDEVITSYSKSTYVKDAIEYKEKCIQMLREKEIYIAEFYFKKKQWLSAMKRFSDYLSAHPNSSFDKRAYYAATVSALRLKDYDNMKILYQAFAKKHAGSPELEAAKKEIEDAD